jgi:hypothetical protein
MFFQLGSKVLFVIAFNIFEIGVNYTLASQKINEYYITLL